MKDIRFSALRNWHIVLLCFNGLADLVVLLLSLVAEALNLPADVARAYRPVFLLQTLSSGISAVSISYGIIYAVLHYKKSASAYYRGFLLLSGIADFLLFIVYIAEFINYDQLGSLVTDRREVLVVNLILRILRGAFLCILAFGRNMGKRLTWALFILIICVDLAASLLPLGVGITPASLFFSTLMVCLTDSTIAFCIKGKYDDKAARGVR